MTATMNVLGNSIAILSAAAVILENRCCRFFFLKGGASGLSTVKIR